jgi:alpha-L-fucosidase
MITRRRFIRNGSTLLAGAALTPGLRSVAEPADVGRVVRPTAGQLAWQDCEVGVLFSFDLPIAAGDTTPNNSSRKTWEPSLYQPHQLNTDEWLVAAKAAGAGYAVFTATHFNGFMQWQSDLYPYGLKQTTWRDGKADVVGDFVASCHKAGIRPGLYLSDHCNAYWRVWDYYVDWGKGRGTPQQAKFNRIAEGMTRELCSRYGPLLELWFDAGTKTPAEDGPDVLPIFEKFQPDGVFYSSRQRADHRWIGNEVGHADNPCWATMPGGPGAISHTAPAWEKCLGSGDPDGTLWSPGMVDVPLRGANGIHNWFWAPGQDRAVQPVETLVRMYEESVGQNCNFVIGAVIKPDGSLPELDARRFAEFGAAVQRRYGRAVAETKGEGSVIELVLPATATLDTFIAMEDIAQGERVREYIIEGRVPGGRWTELGRGQSLGHKRIQHFPRAQLAAIRLRLTRSIAAPGLRRMAVFDTNA